MFARGVSDSAGLWIKRPRVLFKSASDKKLLQSERME